MRRRSAILLTRYAPDLRLKPEPRSSPWRREASAAPSSSPPASGSTPIEKVLTTLAADPRMPLAIDDLASALAKWSAKEGFPAVMDLIQTVFGRIVAQATDRAGPPLFTGEASSLSRLATRQGA